jgi:serine phosphatase RsbU (regulator of sigma subunit)/anti-sigma regulatory factor (Ser/Thr protein kinase)/PAS domain-containing protein
VTNAPARRSINMTAIGLRAVGLMFTRYRQPTPRGSYRWALRVAEMTAWGTAALVVVLVHAAALDTVEYRWGLASTGLLILWLAMLFRYLLPTFGAHRWLLVLSGAVHLLFACVIYGVLRGDVVGAQLIFVPVIIATGLLGRLPEALVVPTAALAGFYVTGTVVGNAPDAAEMAMTGGVFLLSGGVAGVLSKELRDHYRGEREEHRLATAVRHRLMSVVDAVDEAIVFSDRQGVLRVVNRRAAELFDIDPDEYLGLLGVQLQRTLARKTEDPEGFMETFQDVRDDPELELRCDIEQIIPKRRALRLYSSPALDESGTLVGRIDVYTDLTESVQRAAEVERLYEEARRTAESYQRSLLPDSIPTLPRVTSVAHYVPAAGRRAVCGDFYDFVSLPDGRAGVVLGDVCGIGPTAVGDGALTRYTLESFADQDPHPGRLLERMNAHVYEHIPGDRFVRLLFGILDPERAVFEYANAGHVPPVIYRAKLGEAQWLGEGGIALAVEEDSQYKVGRVELEPGDMLVLYTDGVTEAPRRGRPYGQGRFLDLVEAYGMGTPGEMSQAIRRSVDAWVENGELRDDLAILVCQVVPDSVIDEPTRELVLPNETSRLREVRQFVSSFLSDLRAPVDVSSEILLAVNEAAANACKYGKRPDRRSEIRVLCALEGSVVTVVVADDGTGFEPSRFNGWHLPDRFASGGRGLFLMRELMDDVEIDSTPEGTTVKLSRRMASGPR